MLSRSFIQRWNICRLCELHRNAREHVFGHGLPHAHVVFIGEAPGRQEDILGKPFIGRAGKLLKRTLLEASGLEYYPPESWESVFVRLPYFAYITNIVACAPWTDETRQTWREPNAVEAEKCSPRLEAIITDHKPKTIIYIGKVAKKFHKAPKGIPTLQIEHPSSILRLNVPIESSVTYAQTVMRLREHLESVLGVKT